MISFTNTRVERSKIFVLYNFRVDLLEMQFIMLGFGHCPPFIDVILYGDNNSLKIKVPIPKFPTYRGCTVYLYICLYVPS